MLANTCQWSGVATNTASTFFALQQLAVLLVGTALPLLSHLFGTRTINVGHGHDLSFLGQPHQLLAAPPHADVADADAIVGPGPVRGSQHTRGDEQRQRNGACGPSQTLLQRNAGRETSAVSHGRTAFTPGWER